MRPETKGKARKPGEIWESFPVAWCLYESGPDGRFHPVRANGKAAELLGCALEELLRGEWRETRAHPADREAARLDSAALAREGTLTLEYRILDENGRSRRLREDLRLAPRKTGSPLQAIGVWTDITAETLRAQGLKLLNRLNPLLSSLRSLSDLTAELPKLALEIVPEASGAFLALREEEGPLRAVGEEGAPELRDLAGEALCRRAPWAAQAATERKTIVVKNPQTPPGSPQLSWAIAAPLVAHDRLRGALCLEALSDRAALGPDLNDIQRLDRLAPLIGALLATAETQADLARRAEETAALVSALKRLSTLDPTAALEALAAGAKKLFAGDSCRIVLAQSERRLLRCVVAEQDAYADRLLGFEIEWGKGITGAVAASGKSEIIPNALEDPRGIQVPGTPVEPEAIMLAPIKSRQKGGAEETLGVILVSRVGTGRPFRKRDLELLETLADAGAVSIRHARLHAQAVERNRLLAAAHEAVEQMNLAAADPKKLYGAIHKTAAAVIPAGTFVLALRREGEETAEAVYLYANKETFPPRPFPIRGSILGRVLESGRPLRIDDVAAAKPPMILFGPNRLPGSLLAAPLRLGGKVIGALCAQSYAPRAYTAEHQALLGIIAGHAAVALENARLYRELQGYAAELEQKVAERTRRLEELNARLRQANERLAKALEREQDLGRLRTQVVSIVSHEFGTPLSVISTGLDLFERYYESWPPEKRRAQLERIRAAAQRLNALVQDILLARGTDPRRHRFSPQPLELERFCREAADRCQAAEPQHSIRFEYAEAAGAEAPPPELDAFLLESILANLLSNAAKYSPKGSEILFSVRREPERVIFEIRDRGPGIPPEELNRLFEPFQRGSTAGAAPGIGLGLFIVKQGVEAHGGEIRLQSRPGEGLTATVLLPARPGYRPKTSVAADS
ncbi:MAG: GAF domain-containing protein [Verrucomicrobia bacterium]|nr:GAF domain-containing protein [Verrucomicrobiota bacterium]